MNQTDPERLGRDSASSAYRRRRCVGSSNLIAALREANALPLPEPNPDAESGSRVHAAWSGVQGIELSAQERQTLDMLARMEKLVVTDWAGSDAYTLLGRERRLWLHQDLEPIHSGQFDVAYGTLQTHRMLILDAKTLFSEVDPAWANDQMRELVALARFNFDAAEEFTVAILQPWVSQRPTIARYDAAEAELALRLLKLTIADSADPDAPRTPGAWCKYCPALAKCEEARTNIGNTYRLAKRIEAGEFALPIGETGTKVLDSIETAEIALKALRSAYKSLLEAQPDAVPGWYLKSGARVRQIQDIVKAYQIATTAISPAEFLDCTELHITALQEKIGQAHKLKGMAVQDKFNQLFEPVITFKANAPQLARTSPTRGKHKAVSQPLIPP